jgi:hypothetical protein
MYPKLTIILCFLLFSTAINGQTIRKIDLKANDIVYSSQQNSLYATVSAASANKTYGNSVCRIDPTTGTILKSVYVGTEPTCLAVSGDGNYLYVGLEYTPRIMRLKLPEMFVDLTIQLMDTTTSTTRLSVFAEQIKVLPNKPTSIAVIVGHYSSPSFSYISIIDNAVQRPNRGYDRNYLGEVTSMTFIGNTDTLVGILPSYITYFIPVNSQGVRIEQSTYWYGTVWRDKFIKYSARDSFLYTGSNIINPRSTPRFNTVHTFTFNDALSDVVQEIDPYTEGVYFSYQTTNGLLLKRYNSSTRLLTNEWTLSNNTQEKIKEVVSLGKAAKMATLSDNAIYLLDNGCISTITAVPSVIQGYSAKFCRDSTTVLSVNSPNKLLWSTGDTTPTINVSTAGKYSVAFLDAQGCAGPASGATTVTLVEAPQQPYVYPVDLNLRFLSSVTLCQGQTIQLQGANFDNSLISWSTGATGTRLTINQAGDYQAIATNAAGCTTRSYPFKVTYRPIQAPIKPVISPLGGKKDMCSPNERITLNAPSGYKSYLWTNQSTAPSITVSTFSVDSFAVKVTDTEGCSSDLSNFVKIRLLQTPPTPILLYQDSLLKSTNTSAYQHRWFRNGELIGANTVSFKPISGGFYTVQAYTGQCESPFSDWINLTLSIKSALESLSDGGFIQAYPNPTTDYIRIQIISELKGGTLDIYDNIGKLCHHESLTTADNQKDVSLSALPNGTYLLVWKSLDGTTRGLKKIAKL